MSFVSTPTTAPLRRVAAAASLLLLALTSCVSRVSAREAAYDSIREAQLLFQQFQETYSKRYASAEEEAHRFRVFQDNLVAADELNRRDPHASWGVTKFFDLTPQEFKSTYLMANYESLKKTRNDAPVLPQPEINFNLSSPDYYPVSFDWRDKGVVTGVYNQGQCGSCWAFSTTENVESMNAIAGNPLTPLSMQQLVDCDTATGDEGCNGGLPARAFAYLLQTGQDSYASYPYAGVQQACAFNPGAIAAQPNNWGYITTTDDENAMAAWTYQYGPPSVCVDAVMWQYYQSGVVTTSSNCGTAIDHCVQITGWNVVDGISAWTVRNSWGSDWGMAGYIYIQVGYNVCAIGEEVTSCTV